MNIDKIARICYTADYNPTGDGLLPKWLTAQVQKRAAVLDRLLKGCLILQYFRERMNVYLSERDRRLELAYGPIDSDEKMDMGKLLQKCWWLFFLGSMLGSVVETFWCLLKVGNLEMRTSTVIGWFIPVYGMGAVVMTLVLRRMYTKPDWLIAMISGVLGGAVEYAFSFFQEKLLGTVSWDYSDTFMNLNGRTNLSFCLMWALLGLVWVKEIYPRFSEIMDRRKPSVMNLLTWITMVFLVADLIFSAICVYRMEQRKEGIEPPNAFAVWLDRVYDDETMDFFYPNMIRPEEAEVGEEPGSNETE